MEQDGRTTPFKDVLATINARGNINDGLGHVQCFRPRSKYHQIIFLTPFTPSILQKVETSFTYLSSEEQQNDVRLVVGRRSRLVDNVVGSMIVSGGGTLDHRNPLVDIGILQGQPRKERTTLVGHL